MKKIALLQSDDIPVYRYKFSGGNYCQMLSNFFGKIDHTVYFDVYDIKNNIYPNNLAKYDGFIITGSNHSVLDDKRWILNLEKYIHKIHSVGKKVLGICFGHQILAKAFGGVVVRSPYGWNVGSQKINIVNKKIWMNPERHTLNINFYHRDQVVKIPDNADLIATDESTLVQMFSINNQVWAIQGHPEMVKEHNKLLILENKNQLGNKFYTAMKSLELENHVLILAQWIVNFFGKINET